MRVWGWEWRSFAIFSAVGKSRILYVEGTGIEMGERTNEGKKVRVRRESIRGDDNTNMQKQADSSKLNHFLVGVTTVDYLPIV